MHTVTHTHTHEQFACTLYALCGAMNRRTEQDGVCVSICKNMFSCLHPSIHPFIIHTIFGELRELALVVAAKTINEWLLGNEVVSPS